jgi:hypothetical protein
MQNKYVNFLVLIISIIPGVLFLINLFEDVTFFSTKRDTVADVLSMTNPGPQTPYRITLKYFNAYLDKNVICVKNVKKSYGNIIKDENRHVLSINYGNAFPQNVYLKDFETPNIGLIFIDVFITTLMIVFVWLSVKGQIIRLKK